MGGLTAAVAPLVQIGSTVGTIANAIQPFYASKVSEKQLKQQNALSEAQNKANADIQKQIIATNAANSEVERRATLKRAVARQRASAGASGIGSYDGSSEAVLLGMFEESDTERQARERLDNLRTQALNQNLSAQQQSNLLEQSQLQEKNYLSLLTKAYRTLPE